LTSAKLLYVEPVNTELDVGILSWYYNSKFTGMFVISQKSLLTGKWLDCGQIHSLTNLPFPFSVPFSVTPQSPNGC